MREFCTRLWLDQSGTTAVEYALLLTAVAVLAVAAWTSFGQGVSSLAGNAAATLNGV